MCGRRIDASENNATAIAFSLINFKLVAILPACVQMLSGEDGPCLAHFRPPSLCSPDPSPAALQPRPARIAHSAHIAH